MDTQNSGGGIITKKLGRKETQRKRRTSKEAVWETVQEGKELRDLAKFP